ncbi:MAG: hypothetical protein D8M57_07490 [Candidatus Scalindua sp. AMX11]|nr:MAG: hypothetical protein DWQ00_05740 [Candidatus Scalindua sp.]NOG82501.1 hypothetical protein [Planctomycetota bacterium]RZV93933.1 MAG: hypothetical protein EX341_03505 [Candidatus Scalindua sp. SCAELEC01]TDE65552.1 MAG: hypothetical protein D8M57_07490 [Candidatus Scalindua sp. AMX11]GJQ58136.1 MAG: hypothetical protein SCALA701_09370 [Candidatus Scalindua sp.]
MVIFNKISFPSEQKVFLVILLASFTIFFSPLLALSTRTAYAEQNITFGWEPNKEKNLAGYRLYRSDSPGKYAFGEKNAIATIKAGTHSVTVKSVKPGYFVLTAFDKEGNESGPSIELESLSLPNPKGGPIKTILKFFNLGSE